MLLLVTCYYPEMSNVRLLPPHKMTDINCAHFSYLGVLQPSLSAASPFLLSLHPPFALTLGCLSCLWALFFMFCFVLSRCRRYQNRYSHSAETTSLFSWLTCSTTSHLSMAAAGAALGLRLCSPPALWISLVFSLQGCVCMRTGGGWLLRRKHVWSLGTVKAGRLLDILSLQVCCWSPSSSSSSFFKN